MLLSDLQTYLKANGLTNVFQGILPDKPDDAIALYEYGGLNPTFVHGQSRPVIERPRVQVTVRHTSYETAKATVENVKNILTVANQQIIGAFYTRISPVQPPFYLERDMNAINGGERHSFVLNLQVEVRT